MRSLERHAPRDDDRAFCAKFYEQARPQTQPAPDGAGCPLPPTSSLRTGTEHGHGAAILRPARNVVADRDRPLLAVGDRAHALRLHSARDQIVTHRLRTPGPERDVVFARA